jgi:hypothetical protein
MGVHAELGPAGPRTEGPAGELAWKGAAAGTETRHPSRHAKKYGERSAVIHTCESGCKCPEARKSPAGLGS